MSIKKRFCLFLFILLTLLITVSSQAEPSLAKKKLTMKKGNACVLRLNGNSDGQKVTWKTSAKKIVSITSKSHNRAVLKAKRTGSAVITAKIGTKKFKCTVTVKKNSAFPSRITLTVGDKFTFSAAKNAKWAISKKNGTLVSQAGSKKGVFTASRTGKLYVTAVSGTKTYRCRVILIRKDGATKADLAEEKAIEKAKQAEEQQTETASGESGEGTEKSGENISGDGTEKTGENISGEDAGKTGENGSGEDTGKPEENSPEGVSPSELTENQKSVMLALAFAACERTLDTSAVYTCNIHSMDLASDIQAYMLFLYQYLSTDERIKTFPDSPEYNCATAETMKQILIELFGEEDHTLAFASFRTNYVEKEAGGYLYMSGTGEMGDVGLSYFDKPDDITASYSMVCLSGRLMSWNSNMKSYIHTGIYKVYFWKRTDGKFQFDHVEII